MPRHVRAKTVLAAIATGLVLVRAAQAWQRAATPFQIDYAEGTVLAVALRFIQGGSLYPTVGAAPYFLAPYGPVAYLLAAAALKVLGLSLFWPRLLVLVAGLVSALLISALTTALGGRRDIGALAGAAFLCSPLTWIWLPLLRVDLFAVALSLAGLWCFLTGRRLALTAALLVAAVFTKQAAIAAPLTCVAVALIEGRTKSVRNLVVWLFVWSGAAAAAIGPSAWIHLVSTHQGALSIRTYGINLAIAVESALPLLFAISMGGNVWITARTMPAWMYVALCSMTSLTAATIGADSNHFLEWLAAVAWLAAVQISAEPGRSPSSLPVAVILFVTTVEAFAVLWLPRRDIDLPECGAAYRFLRDAPQSRVVSEDVTALLAAGKPIRVSDPFAYARLPPAIWSDGGLEAAMASRGFDLVLVGNASIDETGAHPRWSAEFIRQLRRNYQPLRSFGCSPSLGVIYVPKDASGPGRR